MQQPIRTLALVALVVACSKETERAPAPKGTAAQGVSQAPTAAVAVAKVPTPPASLGPIKVPPDNPLTAAKIALGHRLFFDKRLSSDGSRSCYDCHKNEQGTGGELPLAVGAENKQLPRHAPVMWNVAYLPRFYWDGRADSLEAQAKGAWAGGNMGVGADNLQKKADEIGALPEYKQAFLDVFPTEGATADTIVKAIASYERTLFCGETQFDRFSAGDRSALDEKQKQGWELFAGKANCHSCHTPPFFSDAYTAAEGAYHNTGIGFAGKKPEEVDVGRAKVSSTASDHGAFKTPTLRNVSRTAPYFHDGSVASLEEAVRFMASGGHANPNLDPKLVDKKLSDDEVGAIVAFLGALECSGTLEPPKN